MHRTEVVSTLQFLESVVSAVLHWISIELFGWFGSVVFFSLWFRASSADVMGRKFLSDFHGASPVLMEIGYWDVVVCVWAVLPYFLFFPYLWQDLRTLERAKRLAPLWSGL